MLCGCMWFGPELKSRVLKIVRALNGLKSAGASCHEHLASIMKNVLKSFPCEADPNVWMKMAEKSDGTWYYGYAHCYVADMMIIGADPASVIKGPLCPLKKWPTGASRQSYLRTMFGKYRFAKAWYMSPKEFLANVIPAVEAEWDEKLYQVHYHHWQGPWIGHISWQESHRFVCSWFCPHPQMIWSYWV